MTAGEVRECMFDTATGHLGIFSPERDHGPRPSP